jgi:hypothetical protein
MQRTCIKSEATAACARRQPCCRNQPAKTRRVVGPADRPAQLRPWHRSAGRLGLARQTHCVRIGVLHRDLARCDPFDPRCSGLVGRQAGFPSVRKQLLVAAGLGRPARLRDLSRGASARPRRAPSQRHRHSQTECDPSGRCRDVGLAGRRSCVRAGRGGMASFALGWESHGPRVPAPSRTDRICKRGRHHRSLLWLRRSCLGRRRCGNGPTDLASPHLLVPIAFANAVVIIGLYFGFAALAWGVADAAMAQPRDLFSFATSSNGDRKWRVVHLSDIHVVGERYGFRVESGRSGPQGNERLLQAIAKLDVIHAINPLDLVLITGDITDAGRAAGVGRVFRRYRAVSADRQTRGK